MFTCCVLTDTGYEGYKGWAFVAASKIALGSVPRQLFQEPFIAVLLSWKQVLLSFYTSKQINTLIFPFGRLPENIAITGQRNCAVLLLKGDGLKCWSRTILPVLWQTSTAILFYQVQNVKELDLLQKSNLALLSSTAGYSSPNDKVNSK